MTPLNCAFDFVNFLKSNLNLENIYAGFLPRIDNVKDAKLRCPSIAIRPQEIFDSKDNTSIHLSIYICTFDDDLFNGSHSLFNICQNIRHLILSNNPINGIWRVQLTDNQFTTSIPDDQIFPFWLAAIDFFVDIPAVHNNSVINFFTR